MFVAAIAPARKSGSSEITVATSGLWEQFRQWSPTAPPAGVKIEPSDSMDGRDVLDLCCNAGGFALHAARAGARRVTAVDLDEGGGDLVGLGIDLDEAGRPLHLASEPRADRDRRE